MDIAKVKQWIRLCEGFQEKPYFDTVGKLTIGYGRNLDDVGISRQEADQLLDNDINHTLHDLSNFSWYVNQPEHVQLALINMCFNLGLPRLLTFKKMIKALSEKDYTTASKEALNSLWGQQVGKRAQDVAVMMREGS